MQRQVQSRGVIVYRDGGCPEQPFQQPGDVGVPFPAAAGHRVVFKVRITRQNRERPERGAAEIGVEDNPGGVDHPAKRRAIQGRERLFDPGFDRGSIPQAGTEVAARRIENAADFAHHQRVRVGGQGGGEAFQDFVHRRQGTEQIGFRHAFDGSGRTGGGASIYEERKKSRKSFRPADKRNMEILATALQGLDRAQSQFDQAAAKISQAGISDTGSSGDTVDLATEIVNLAVAKDEYSANLKALQAGEDLVKHTIDILA
jgi:hypothetical protein